MNLEIGFVLLLIVAAIWAFADERIPVDLTALMVMAILMLSRIVSPEEGLIGFSNTATVTVGAMFILSAGLFRTGALNGVGFLLSRLGRINFWVAMSALMICIGALSAFINNTAAVAIFLPIAMKMARSMKISPSKLLMPLSFASIFGGVCTLIGTSTNLLVSSIAERHNLEGFHMFEFTGLGAIVFGAGFLYLLTLGIWLIPKRRALGELNEEYGLGKYVTEIFIDPTASVIGKKLKDWSLLHDLEIDVLQLIREGQSTGMPRASTTLLAGDVLRVSGRIDQIKNLDEAAGVTIKPGNKWRKQSSEAGATLVEAVIAPNSRLESKSILESRLRETRKATVLAIRHRGELVQEHFKSVPLRAGDALLLEVPHEHLDALKKDSAFVITSQVNLPFRKDKIIPALAIVAAVVIAAALNWVPIVVGAITGCIAMILTGCLTLEEAYKAVEWKVIFLLAGILTLGLALENTGGAVLIADSLSLLGSTWGAAGILSALIVATILMTSVISNAATVALLAPIAIAMAETHGFNTRPFLIAVTFAASLSFITPIGYQTNTMIYAPGQYKFTDFFRVGILLNILLAILLIWLIPQFWPF